MAIRTTDTANRMASEAVLLTQIIEDKLVSSGRGHSSGRGDAGVMAATLAGTIISTFGNSIMGKSLFEEVDDAEVAPATLVTEPPATR